MHTHVCMKGVAGIKTGGLSAQAERRSLSIAWGEKTSKSCEVLSHASLQISRQEFGMKWSHWHISSCEHKSLLNGLYFRRGWKDHRNFRFKASKLISLDNSHLCLVLKSVLTILNTAA